MLFSWHHNQFLESDFSPPLCLLARDALMVHERLACIAPTDCRKCGAVFFGVQIAEVIDFHFLLGAAAVSTYQEAEAEA